MIDDEQAGAKTAAADYDSPWKEALDVYFEQFMAFFFPAIHAEIDWSRGYEPLDKELQKVVREAEIGRRYVDKLVKVWLKGGEEQWILIHVEVQTSEESGFARRMYVYNYRLFDRYNRVVVSLAVLADDNPDWRPDEYSHGLWGYSAGIRFPIAKLLDYADDEAALERNPNPFALVVLAYLKTRQTRNDARSRRAWKVRLVKGLYERGMSAEDVVKLFRFIDWMMELPPPLDREFLEEIHEYEEEKHMPFITTPERIGREDGLRQGLQQGLQQGRQEGRQEGLLKGIAAVLKVKFGEDGLRLLPEIRSVEEPEKLEAILDAVETARSPEDLRRVWSSQRTVDTGNHG